MNTHPKKKLAHFHQPCLFYTLLFQFYYICKVFFNEQYYKKNATEAECEKSATSLTKGGKGL